MTVTAPVVISPAPEPPDRAQRSTFNVRAVAWADYQKNTLVPGVNSATANVAANAADAFESATSALNAASAATAARDTAFAAANFKGDWSTLSGPLNMPACVRHAGRFWVLLANLADVAAATPGVSASWAALDAGTVPSALLTVAGATVNAVVGVRYIVAANNVTLVAPTSFLKGDYHGARWMTGFTGGVWNFGSTLLRGWAASTMEIDVERFGLDLFYEDATRGLV